jgi:2-hydroxy-3-oxopropionate reductase
MAPHLAAAGYELVVWNRTREKAEPLAASGARVADNPAEAARDAGVVIAMLADGPTVNHVLFGTGVAETLVPESVVIDMSSIPPAAAREHAQLLAERGVAHLDAPVSGGTVGAAEATLAIMAGGERDAFERARPLLETMGRPTYVGPPGSGQLAKCVNQLVVAVTIGAVAEGLLLAESGGADPAAVREAILGGFAESRILREHGARMLARNFVPGGFSRLQLKDLDTILDVAEQAVVELPFASLARELFADLVDHGDGELDHSALYLELERQAKSSR